MTSAHSCRFNAVLRTARTADTACLLGMSQSESRTRKRTWANKVCRMHLARSSLIGMIGQDRTIKHRYMSKMLPLSDVLADKCFSSTCACIRKSKFTTSSVKAARGLSYRTPPLLFDKSTYSAADLFFRSRSCSSRSRMFCRFLCCHQRPRSNTP